MSQHVVYGFPCVRNPHDFIPDPNASTEKERVVHAEACRTWGTLAFVANLGCETQPDGPDGTIIHVSRSVGQGREWLRPSWGLGTNVLHECDGACDEWPDDEPLIACHDCGRDYCRLCWAIHDTTDEDCRR